MALPQQFQDLLRKHQHCSLTELEARVAALDTSAEARQGRRVWFHLRDAGYRASEELYGPEEDEAKRRRVEGLREEMRAYHAAQGAACAHAVQYAHPLELSQRVRAELSRQLALDLPRPLESASAQESAAQVALQARLLASFVELRDPRRERTTHALLQDLVWGTGGNTVALVGPEGSGKSSICACIAQHAAERAELGLVLMHFVQCSEQSRKPEAVMRRMLEAVKAKLGDALADIPVPDTLAALSQALSLALDLADARLAQDNAWGLLIIDAVDRLEYAEELGALAVSWLRWKMPDRINLIVSFGNKELPWLRFVQESVDRHASGGGGLLPNNATPPIRSRADAPKSPGVVGWRRAQSRKLTGEATTVHVRHVPVVSIEDGIKIVVKYLEAYDIRLSSDICASLKEWLELENSGA